jgi:hypothetical protein
MGVCLGHWFSVRKRWCWVVTVPGMWSKQRSSNPPPGQWCCVPCTGRETSWLLFDQSRLWFQYIDAELPPESPYLYGLHPNAEIGFLTQTSEKLFRTVLEMQPRDSQAGDGAGITREEKVSMAWNSLRNPRLARSHLSANNFSSGRVTNIYTSQLRCSPAPTIPPYLLQPIPDPLIKSEEVLAIGIGRWFYQSKVRFYLASLMK